MSEKLKRFISNNKQLLIMLGAIAVVFIILALTVPSFATLRNLTNLLQMIAPIAVMACGATYVLVIGGMDISNPAVMAASAVVGVYFMTTLGCNLIVGTFVILLTSALLGLINGFAIAKLKMVPMVVTLSMMTIGTGLATFLSGVRGLPRLPDSFSEFFNKTAVIIILIIVTVVLDFILTGTKFGRKLYYIGNNARTAKVSISPCLPMSSAVSVPALRASLTPRPSAPRERTWVPSPRSSTLSVRRSSAVFPQAAAAAESVMPFSPRSWSSD